MKQLCQSIQKKKPLEEPEKTRIARHRKLAKYLLKTPETETGVIINDEENEQQEKRTENEKDVQEQLEDQQIDNDLNRFRRQFR